MTSFAFPSLNDQITQIRRTYASLLRSIQFHISNTATIISHLGHIEQFLPLRQIWPLWVDLDPLGFFGPLWAILAVWVTWGHFAQFALSLNVSPFWDFGV